MMAIAGRAVLRRGFDRIERAIDALFGADWNPLAWLGSLGWFLFWIVAATGAYLFIFFDTGVTTTYAAIEWLTVDHWWHAGVARSLHRYASDLMVLVMFTHMLREFVMDRYRGRRWFSWLTGVPIIWFVYLSGITGYWLVWDQLAQYIAVTTTELLDTLGIFAEPIARNFLSPETLSGRFFTLMVFLHIAIPLLLLLLMWVHIQRISDARTNPPQGLAAIVLAALVAGSIMFPAMSQPPANLDTVPQTVGIDWFILGLYPVIESVPSGVIWWGALVFTIILAGLPWLPPRAEVAAAQVFLDHCNGCGRCVADCPYSAITLEPRSDGLPFAKEAMVNSDRCVACGICMGSCPSSTPFRRVGPLITGIDLPGQSLAVLRGQVIAASAALPQSPGRVLTLACAHGAGAAEAPGLVSVPCVAMVPPSLIDYVISRGLAEGIALAGCAERECHNRFGIDWTRQRLARERDPFLRERVPRERIVQVWAGPTENGRLERELAAFSTMLRNQPAYENLRPLTTEEQEEALSSARPVDVAR